MPAAAADYVDLTPDAVLEALDACGLRGDGRLIQLNSYENRVFQVFLEDGAAVVAKFYRPGRWSDEQILEEHRFALQLAAEEVPAVPPMVLAPREGAALRLMGEPPTLAAWGDRHNAHRWAVCERRAGREPELEREHTLAVLGRFIGRLHTVGACETFCHRRQMAPAVEARQARDYLAQQNVVPPNQWPAWQSWADRAIDRVAHAFEQAPRMLRLHGDCHLGNVLWRDGMPHIVDLDDACMGPAVQDLWMLISGDASTMQRQLESLLSGYTQFRDFDRREIALIEPLRTLRMLRHSAWIAERWSDPTFPMNFAYFDSEAYWNQQTTQLREQVEAMSG